MRLYKHFIYLLLLVEGFCNMKAQNNFDFLPPVKIPMYLSGNFGEIRSNHFHTGIDIKTGGVIGEKVYSVSKGYISRIKIRANGYGNALYIKHTNGYTSVYGHLDQFRDDIKQFVKEKQYANKKFEIDLYLDSETFIVEKGEFIAFSGNSGGSGGPHLHFEIRDKNQQPLNVLRYPIDIKDNIAPKFRNIYLYPIDGGNVNNSSYKYSIPTIKQGENYLADKEIKVQGRFGIGVEVYDYLNGSNNRCGIYSLELRVDGNLYNKFQIDYLNFSKVRYLNAHIDFEEKFVSKKNIHLLYKLPNNKLDFYKCGENNGILEILDTLNHFVDIVATDAYGNKSSLRFNLKGEQQNMLMDKQVEDIKNLMRYSEVNTFNRNDIKLVIKPNSLYDDIGFKYYKVEENKSAFSKTHYIHKSNVPLHKFISLYIKPDSIPEKFKSKMTLALVEGNEVNYAGGVWRDDFLFLETRDFGRYIVTMDTIKPEIKPLNFVQGGKVIGKNTIKLVVRDDFSGIKSFNCYIDDKWALFSYDKKNDILIHEIDNNRFKSGISHRVKVIATDELDNVSEIEFDVFW